MYTFIAVIILIVCLLLILIVLVQNSKGGGLASNFSGSNQVMGVRRTADFLEKATWTLASALLVLSVIGSWVIEKKEVDPKSRLEQVAPSKQDQPVGLPQENTDTK